MWTRKEDERPQQNMKPASPAAQPPRPASAPAGPGPGYLPQPASGAAGMAIIGASVSIRGDISSGEDLVINGTVEGTVQMDQHRLAVGPRGKVRARVVAREVLIQGSVEGNIQAGDKIVIRNEGNLVGDIQVAGIVIEDGAYFKGSIDIIRPQAAAPAPGEKAAAAGS